MTLPLPLSDDKLRALHPDLNLFVPLKDRPLWLKRAREHLRAGEQAPAVVVHTNPFLVAAYAKRLDCVLLLELPPGPLSDALEVGARLLAINRYLPGQVLAPDLLPNTEDEQQYADVIPYIAEFLCDVDELITAGKEEIPEEDWARCHQLGEARLHIHYTPRDGRPLFISEPGRPGRAVPPEPLPSPFEPGQQIGPYALEEMLGRGSMGEVWKATGDDGAVALKLPLRPAFLRHLRQEGLFLEQVDHPNVARFLGADLEAEIPWLATELVEGQPLRALCRGTIQQAGATLICDQLLAGLQAIHEAGVLHLDLKPENVLVQHDGEVKIVDLGLGHATTRFMEEVYLSVSLVSRVPPVAGTLAYMAPEQRKGKELDPRTDLYAFGILLHELLSGRLPEPGKLLTELRPELATRWDVVVARLTHPQLAKRPKDARDARHLVSYTLADKANYPVPEGGIEPRDLSRFDQDAFDLTSPYSPGMVIGDGYELEQLLGRGGFGEVWRARRGSEEEGDVEQVALKLLLDPKARQALAREAEVAQRVDHPWIPKVVADQSQDDPPHIVFELVTGSSLRLLIHEEEQLSLRRVIAIFEGMVEVVQACAEAGVVHMDLKPEHFLAAQEPGQARPRVSLIDFGLAALAGPREGLRGSLASQADVRGTLDYMAPEQRKGRISPAVDVYALGVCLFEMLTFHLPRGPQRLKTLRRDVPHRLDDVALSMLATNPRARPKLTQVLETLRGLNLPRPTTPSGRELRIVEPGFLQHLRRLVSKPAFIIPVVLLVGLLVIVGSVYGPRLIVEHRGRDFSPADVRQLGDVQYPPLLVPVPENGLYGYRRGKVLILQAPISGHLLGLGRNRLARLDRHWAYLPDHLRATRASEVKTLISFRRLGTKSELIVYDMVDRRRVKTLSIASYPKFAVGSEQDIHIHELIELMPLVAMIPPQVKPKPKGPLPLNKREQTAVAALRYAARLVGEAWRKVRGGKSSYPADLAQLNDLVNMGRLARNGGEWQGYCFKFLGTHSGRWLFLAEPLTDGDRHFAINYKETGVHSSREQLFLDRTCTIPVGAEPVDQPK